MKNEEKKMKKKVIASILAASMAAMALTGCGGGKTTSEHRVRQQMKPQPAQRQEVRQMAQKHRI